MKTIGSIDTRGNSWYQSGINCIPDHSHTKKEAKDVVDTIYGLFDGEWAGDADFGYISKGVRRKLKKFIDSGIRGIANYSLTDVNIIPEHNQ